MIVLIHNILPPYRIPLFNAIGRLSGGRFTTILMRATHRRRRKWTVPWREIAFDYKILRTFGLELGNHALDYSLGTGKALSELRPTVVVVAGWNLNTSWAARRWAKKQGVPVIAWVESSKGSGGTRGRTSNGVRRRFLKSAAVALVPGADAESFVRELQPDIPCVRMPNSVGNKRLRHLAPNPYGGAIFVGELSARKGFDLVLKGADAIVAEFGQLIVAGQGPLEPELRQLTTLNPHVAHLGFVEGDNFVDALAQSSIVLLPSRADPWPLVSVEALVAGRPVVLGVGVGSAHDLQLVAGAAVGRMESSTVTELVRASQSVTGAVVSEEARDAWTPERSASAFMEAVSLAIGLSNDE